MKYYIDKIEKNLIRGWCFDDKNPTTPVILELLIDGQRIAKEKANIYREGLYVNKMHPTGMAGFEFNFEKKHIEPRSKIEIRVKDSGFILIYQKTIDSFNFRKKKLCVVHIGMHKTGSSSIQQNLNKTQNKNFHYFNLTSTNPTNHSLPIFSMFSNNKYNYQIHKKMGRNKNSIDHFNQNTDRMFKHNIHHNNQDIFVLSGEDIIALKLEELKDLKKYLFKYFHTVKIVAYVRPPISYLNSAVQEVIKSGTANLQQSARGTYPKYKHKFDKFDTVFGKENVALYFFSKSILVENDVTADFLYKQKLDVKEKKFSSINESMSLEAIALLYIFNKYSSSPIANSKGNKAKQKLLRSLQKVGSKKFALSKEYIQKVVDYDKDDLLWIENRMNMKISDEKSYTNSVDSVKHEEDLYEAAKTVINELKSIIGDNQVTKDIIGNSPKDIAKLMDLLYGKLYD